MTQSVVCASRTFYLLPIADTRYQATGDRRGRRRGGACSACELEIIAGGGATAIAFGLDQLIREAMGREDSDKRVCWGTEEEELGSMTSRTNAATTHRPISPSRFHRRRDRPGQDSINQLRREIHGNILGREKKKICENLAVKRAAFKHVTSLRTFPTQAHAFDFQHDHLDNTDAFAEASQADGSSSLSSASLVVHEPKRQYLDEFMSPAKSRLQARYHQEFLTELRIPRPLSMQHQFGPTLWSVEPRVFSVEKSRTGNRKYIVGHLGRFLDHYWRKTDPNNRHYYELIQEDSPCRLYLDLEFSKQTNSISDVEAESLLTELFEELRDELSVTYDLAPITRADIVDLNSSTEKKFSRHWIVHLPNGVLFRHNVEVGKFMRKLISRLADLQATGQLDHRPHLSKYFVVQTSSAEDATCFVDLGVYTRNRLFRLLGSSKYGKPASASLRIAETNQFAFPSDFSNDDFYAPSLMRRPETKELPIDVDIDNHVQQFETTVDWTSHAEALGHTLVVPPNSSLVDNPLLPLILNADAVVEARVARATVPKLSSTVPSRGPSPYPALDDFILRELGSRGGVAGLIRAWSVDRDNRAVSLRVTYHMCNNRWCEAIGRAHRSNNIMWTADLRTWECIQTCHDPDCRAMNFRSHPVPIPDHVQCAVRECLLDEELAAIDEKELIATVGNVVSSCSEGNPTNDRPAVSLFDDDSADESFERALLSLNLNDHVDRTEVSATKASLERSPKENDPHGFGSATMQPTDCPGSPAPPVRAVEFKSPTADKQLHYDSDSSEDLVAYAERFKG